MSNVVAVEGGLHVALHPLPILNVSEHLTRVSLQLSNTAVCIVGGLLGTQKGREVEIMNSFELVIDAETNKVDFDYFVTRKEQFKQVFPSFDFLGWYSVGPAPAARDLFIHQQFFEYNESPLFLQLSAFTPSSAEPSRELPVKIYETVVDSQVKASGEPDLRFVPVEYEIETGEAERVAVDFVSNENASEGGSQVGLIATLTTQRNAIKMLYERIAIVVDYLTRLEKGTVDKDAATLRMISALVTSLPAVDSNEFRQEFMTEYNDVLLTTYLASLTKQLSSANELLDQQMFLLSGNSTSNTHSTSNGGGFSSSMGGGFAGRSSRSRNKADRD